MFFLKPREQTLFQAGFRIRLVALVFVCAVAVGSLASAQWRDDFEAGPLRWRIWTTDTRAQLVRSERTATFPHSGIASEMLEVSVGLEGTFLHLAYPLEERVAVIDELRCSFWVRAAASGMRPAFRVVFPRTAHPATQEPITTLLIGTPSTGGGHWSEVEVKNPVTLLEQQRRVIKAQFGAIVDLRDAYIDAIVLNIYNGPGNTKVQIDDLAVDGMVSFELSPIERPVMTTTTTIDNPESEAAERVAAKARDIRASVPRWLQYHGENLDWLPALGINGLVVDAAPTANFLREAQRLNLAVVAPPPNLMPAEEDLAAWEAVQSWSLGWAVDQAHLDTSRDTTIRLNRLPVSLRRPTLVEPMEAYGPYSRLADLLAVPIPLPTTIRNHDEAELLLQAHVDSLRGRTLPLTSIMLEPLEQWYQQKAGIAAAIGSNAGMIDGYDLGQARLQVMRSIGHGARGWYFRMLNALDSGDPDDARRAESLASLNSELRLLSPWIQTGEPAVKIPVDAKTGYIGYRIAMPRSQLIILASRGDNDQIVVPSINLPSLPLKLPRTQQTTQVYRISRGQLESLSAKPSPDGWNLTIPNPAAIELLVVTEDPRAITYLQSSLARIAPTLAEARLDIAEQSLRLAQMTLVAEQLPQRDEAWNEIARAQSSLRGAEQFLERGDLIRCFANADAACAAADQVTAESWKRATLRFPASNSTPLLTSRLSLPLHWELDRTIRNRTWEPVGLPQSDFEDMNAMTEAGWTFARRMEDRVSNKASVVDQIGPDRSRALILEAASIDRTPLSGGYAGASLHVASPAVPVPVDSLVHWEGLVRVIQCGSELQSGLLVYDDEGGPAMGQLINLQTGNANSWQSINLYRLATKSHGARLHFETRGAVQVAIDQVRIEYLMPSPVPRVPSRPPESDAPTYP
jgi:hypothetical protein